MNECLIPGTQNNPRLYTTSSDFSANSYSTFEGVRCYANAGPVPVRNEDGCFKFQATTDMPGPPRLSRMEAAENSHFTSGALPSPACFSLPADDTLCLNGCANDLIGWHIRRWAAEHSSAGSISFKLLASCPALANYPSPPPALPPPPSLPPPPPFFPGFAGWESTAPTAASETGTSSAGASNATAGANASSSMVFSQVPKYPQTKADKVAFESFNRRCIAENGRPCVPCSTFGAGFVTSMSEPAACVDCRGNVALAAFLLALVLICLLIIIGVFVRMAAKYTSAMRRWVSTCLLILGHAQTLAVIGGLGLEWPESVLAIMRAFKLDIGLAQPECYSGTLVGDDLFWLYSLCVCGVATMLLVTPRLAILVGRACRRPIRLQLPKAARGADPANEPNRRSPPKDARVEAELAQSVILSSLLLVTLSLTASMLRRGSLAHDLKAGKGLVIAALATAAIMLLVQVSVVVQMVHHIVGFHRGATTGDWWPEGGGRGDGKRALPPRLQHRRVEFLVGRWREPKASARRGWLVRSWQLVIWLRQFLLLVVATVGSAIIEQAELSAQPTQRIVAQGLVVGVALSILLVAWYLQRKFQPYALRYQNTMEAWLLMSACSTIGLASIYSALPAQPVTARIVLEVVLLAVLIGSLVLSAGYFAWRARALRRALEKANLSSILTAANEKIDAPVLRVLKDGTVRLLRCDWLASAEAEPHLRRDDVTGALHMPRLQDLPNKAFFSPAEAANLFTRGDRSVFVLSYGWNRCAPPSDPTGVTLAAVRRFLSTAPKGCALFWECVQPSAGYSPFVALSLPSFDRPATACTACRPRHNP